MTYDELESEVFGYLENCSASGIVELYNFIFDCKAEVDWNGEDNPNVTIKESKCKK
jgi:hypothetical protein